jgi:hypothetical protein
MTSVAVFNNGLVQSCQWCREANARDGMLASFSRGPTDRVIMCISSTIRAHSLPDAYLHKVEPRAGHRGSPSRHMQSFGGLLLMRFFPCTISSVSPRLHCVELAGMVRAVAGSRGTPPHSHARVRRSKENQFHIVGRLSHTRRISPRRWSDHTSVGSVGALAD